MKILEQLCKLFCDLTGFELSGKSVLLRIDDTNHLNLVDIVVQGTIYDIKTDIIPTESGGHRHLTRSSAVIHIDPFLNFDGRNIEWLMVVPRHRGYGFYRLYCMWIAVYIYILESQTLSQDLSWNDIHAIGSLKLLS